MVGEQARALRVVDTAGQLCEQRIGPVTGEASDRGSGMIGRSVAVVLRRHDGQDRRESAGFSRAE
ncbi:hypothetical protein DF165_07555 [Burkholderia cenocepacia]|nr:hypothetical protein C6T64_00690 [Burkholderia cenocepacia]RQT99024.1 hypothetical protein DF165_07555 [Burkholderia cenocepacia]